MPGRTHSREFKLQVCREIAHGEKRPAQVCREHQLADSLLSRWRKEYAERGEVAWQPKPASESETVHTRIAELERLCGQLALENSALKKALQQSRSASGIR